MITTNTSIKIVGKDTYLASTPYGLRVKVKDYKELEVMVKDIYQKSLVIFICECVGNSSNLVVDYKSKDLVLNETIDLLVDDKDVRAEHTESGYNFDTPVFTLDVKEHKDFVGIIASIIK